MRNFKYYTLSAAALSINTAQSQFLSLTSDAGVHFNQLTYEDDCAKPFALEGFGDQRIPKWSYNHKGFCEQFIYRGNAGAPRNRFNTKSVCLVCVGKHRLFNLTNPAPVQTNRFVLSTRMRPVNPVIDDPGREEEEDEYQEEEPEIMGRSLFAGDSNDEADSFSFDDLDFANMDLSEFEDLGADLGIDLAEEVGQSQEQEQAAEVQVSQAVAPGLFKPESKICSLEKITPFKSENPLCQGFLTRWTYNIEQERCAATYFTGCYEEPNFGVFEKGVEFFFLIDFFSTF